MHNGHTEQRIELEITPGPWTVESHPDTEGAYIIREARHEQDTWVIDGYDISEDEGDRRNLIVVRRDRSNIRLIQSAPELLKALENILLFPDKGRVQAVETLNSIVPNWQKQVTPAKIRGEDHEFTHPNS